MKRIIFSLFLLYGFAAGAQTADQWFETGYAKYENGNYQGAI